jgi:hypothetical protein
MSLEVHAIDAAGPQFARPFVDLDEERLQPRQHRYVHGGFKGTTARFALYFPPNDIWRGRFLQNPGANLDAPGSETILMQSAIGGLFGGIDVAFDAGT